MEKNIANKITEVIFLGLPGPTHHYGGLSADNVASSKNRGNVSEPRLAAKQVLELARLLLSFGQRVAILPPQLRPYLPELKKHFTGSDEEIISKAHQNAPQLLEAVSSSASMWAANAATVTYGHDQKIHITAANLATNLHRRIEAHDSYFALRDIFARVPRSFVHMPLLVHEGLRDEGAANHMRLSTQSGDKSLNVFVYGADGGANDPETARQTLSATQALIAKHRLNDAEAIMVKQSATAIKNGVFHNDVIALSHENFLLIHENAYAMGMADMGYIERSFEDVAREKLKLKVVTNAELTIEEAVSSYFFNSQIISLANGEMLLIAPEEAREVAGGKARKLIETMINDAHNPITKVHYVNVRQSMKNGGGPACLRLRVPMDEAQYAALSEHSRVLMNEARIQSLEDVIERIYPETLYASDINYALYQCSKETLHAMGIALGLKLLR